MSVRKKQKQRLPQQTNHHQLQQYIPQELQHQLQHLQQQPQQAQQPPQVGLGNHHNHNHNNNTTFRAYPHHYYYDPTKATMLALPEQQQQPASPPQGMLEELPQHYQRRFFIESKPSMLIRDCHNEDICNLIELTDGTLVTTSYDRTIKRWTRQGQLLQTFSGHAEGILAATQIDDRTFATGSIDRLVKFWDLETGQCLTSFDGHQLAVHCIIKLRHQHQFEDLVKAVGTHHSRHHQTSSSTGSSLFPGADGVSSFEKERKKTLLATGSMDTIIRIFSIEDQTLLHTFQEHTSSVRSLCELKDGTLVSGSHDCLIKVWNLREWRCERTLRGHSSWVLLVTPIGSIYDDEEEEYDDDCDYDDCSIDTSTTTTGTSSKESRRRRRRRRRRRGEQREWKHLFVASSSVDETVMIWNAKNGDCLRTLVGHSNPIESLIRLNPADKKPKSSTIATTDYHRHGHSHHEVELRRHQHPRIFQTLKQHHKKQDLVKMRMRANPQEGEYDEQLKHHYDPQSTQEQHRLQEDGIEEDEQEYDSDEDTEDDEEDDEDHQLSGEMLASGAADGEVRVWDVKTGECLDSCKTGGRVIALVGLRGEVSCSIATTVNGWENKEKIIAIRKTWNRQRSLVHACSWVVARHCASDGLFESLKPVLPDEVFHLLTMCYQHLWPSYLLPSSSSSPSISKTSSSNNNNDIINNNNNNPTTWRTPSSSPSSPLQQQSHHYQ